MSDIASFIRRDVEDDVSLKPHAFTVDVLKKGLFAKQRTIRVGGTVATERERARIQSIVNHHAGDAYLVEFSVRVQEHART